MAKKKKNNKNKNKKCSYLLFCESCGQPSLITKTIMIEYVRDLDIEYVLCDCGHHNKIPQYLKNILDELIDSI